MASKAINEAIEARGPLSADIRLAVSELVRDWEKEHGARVSHIYIPMHHVGVGPESWYDFGFVDIDILMPDGTEISSTSIKTTLPGRVFP